MDNPIPELDGNISEWNEGNLKNLRMHEAHELINSGKVNPFALNKSKTNWNYLDWKAGVDVLFGEGFERYSKDELEESEKQKKFVDIILKTLPPFLKEISNGYGNQHTIFISIEENQEKIKDTLYNYEKIVKKYNNLHGLSTRNKEVSERGRAVLSKDIFY